MPFAENQQPRMFYSDSVSQEELQYSTSETVMVMGPIAVATPVTETQTTTSQLDRSTPSNQ